jgi:hypothetical protein
MDEIGKMLRKITEDKSAEIYSVVCTVESVDEAKRTADVAPINGNAEIFDVRLQSALNGSNGLCIFPVVGSVVVVTFLNKLTGYVSLFSEIDKITLDTENEITIDGGQNGGLVKVNDLLNKINTIESKLNALQMDYSIHTHIDPISGFTGPLAIPFVASPITPTLLVDIENDKIKH